jgi:hypothetical protein
VDVNTGKGRFLYVNPTGAMTSADQGPAPPGDEPSAGKGFELVVEDGSGRELQRLRPAILLPSDAEHPRAGLIDQSIPFIEGMKRLVLIYEGAPVDTFEAGAPQSARVLGGAANAGLLMGAAPPGSPEKRNMSLDSTVAPEPGVSYTVQVRPGGEMAWHTIAVGRKTPDVALDRNQFPGAERATVRVLRSTGFENSVVAEDEVSLGFDE